MNVEIGTEAAQFPEKEYKNGICVAFAETNRPVEIYRQGEGGPYRTGA